jgi:hypothetical protein
MLRQAYRLQDGQGRGLTIQGSPLSGSAGQDFSSGDPRRSAVPPLFGGIFQSPVEPETPRILTLDQSPGDMHSRPISRARHQSLFATVG